MANRATQQGMLDANSQLPLSFVPSSVINTTNSTTTISGATGVFHGFLVVGTSSGAYTLTAYDAATTTASGLTSATVIGVLNSTTASGATAFQWGGDIIVNNGITVVAVGGTSGVTRIIYL